MIICGFDKSLFPNNNYDEFYKKYSGTYLRLLMGSKWITMIYKSWDGAIHTFWSENLGYVKLGNDTDIEVKGLFPNQKVFQHNGMAHYYHRTTKRMWKKAPNNENSVIQRLHTNLNEFTNLEAEILDSAFSPEYVGNIKEAMDANIWSTAINKDWAVSNPLSLNNKSILWFMSCPIGFVKPREKEILLMNKYVRQELLDLLHNKHNEKDEWRISE